MSSFFRELKQRKVYRVPVGRAVVAWLVMQIVALGFSVALELNSKAHW
jgi:hypothetical protein